jgi:hypothetical protein
LESSYEAEHARLAARCISVAGQRLQKLESGKIKPLAAASEEAADRCYADTATKLCDGLEVVLKTYEQAGDQRKAKVYEAWVKAGQ